MPDGFSGRQAKVAVGNFPRRSPMRSIDDPSSMTPDERFAEIAVILAGGVLRLHARAAISADNLEKSPDFAAAGLEVSAETVLSVHRS
jgi:hypothetical protein